jgi:hypothetical protein
MGLCALRANAYLLKNFLSGTTPALNATRMKFNMFK